MKTETNYQHAKAELKENADVAKIFFRNDFPAIRQEISDCLDSILKCVDLTEHKRNLLSNYACTLHPKN